VRTQVDGIRRLTRKSTPIVALASSSGNHCSSENRIRRLLLPTEEFPIRSSLQLMIEFVVAIGEGEEMVVYEQIPSAPFLERPLGSWRARERLLTSALHSLHVKLGIASWLVQLYQVKIVNVYAWMTY
jgi:hypothetical protein